MQAGHILAGLVSGNIFGLDIVKRQRAGINDPCVGRAIVQQFLRHDRACIEADRRAAEDIATTDGDQIRGTGAGADEMDGHG
jgi:hypothetical protein